MKFRIIILILFAFISSNVVAQQHSDKLFRGYSGGMMLHAGYISSGELIPITPSSQIVNPIEIKGFTTGIGGKLMVALGDHLRVGTEGYVSTMNYGDNREVSLGWGGLATDYGFNHKKWYFYSGLTLGGGVYENLCAIDSPTNDDTPLPTIWKSYSLFILAPYIGVERQLTSSIRLALKLDWITAPALSAIRSDFASGPRLYLGIMFARFKD